MKIFKILFLVCFLTIGAFAQQGATLTGTIFLNGQPIGGAIVELRPATDPTQIIRATTDAAGVYTFENLPAGTYQIWAEKRGPEERAGLVGAPLGGAYGTARLKSGQVRKVDLTLTQAVYSSQLTIREQVLISAGTVQPIDEVAKTVNVIEGQEMRERADFSLVETLRTIPGFRVQQLGGFGRAASIKTRGLRNQDTAILLDGVRFRDASAITGDASPFLSDFTLTSVSRVEVLRGSGSSLYGTNAIGGTIDFRTPAPEPGPHGQISGAFGGYGLGRFRGNFSDGTRDGKFGFNTAISRTVYTRGLDGEDDAHNTNFQARVDYNPFEKTDLSARFFVADAYVRLNSNPDTLGTLPTSATTIITAAPNVNFRPDANDPDNFQKSKFFNGQIVLTQLITEDLVFRGYYAGLKTSRKNVIGPLGPGFQSASTSLFDGLIHTASGRFDWTPNRANEITAGYEFEREKFGNDGFTPSGSGNFFTRASQSSSTFYVQDLVSFLGRRLQLAGGFRAQFFNLEAPRFSAAGAPYTSAAPDSPPAAYTFDGAASYYFARTATKVRAHVGNGYRVPSLYERFGTFFSPFFGGFVALGDPELKPERSLAFDGGIEQHLFRGCARLSAVYFYTRLSETIGFGSSARTIPGTPRFFGGYLNTAGGLARGGEFSARIKAAASSDIFTSYTFTNSDQRTPQVAASGVIETLGIPKHQFTLVATQRIARFWVNVDLLATSNYLAPIFSNTAFRTFIYRFAGNRKADLTAGYNFAFRGEKLNLRLFGTVENLFDYDYYENGFRTTGRTGRVGLSFGF